MGSLAAAVEKLKVGGGRVIIIGQVKCNLTAETVGSYSGTVTVVGQDEESALLFDKATTYFFEPDTVIDSIKLKATSAATIAACYTPLTVTDSVRTEGDISVVGSGVKTTPGTIYMNLAGGHYKSVAAIGAGASAEGTDAEINMSGATADRVTLSDRSGKYGYGVISVSGIASTPARSVPLERYPSRCLRVR